MLFTVLVIEYGKSVGRGVRAGSRAVSATPHQVISPWLNTTNEW
jgi:hypothetical protein